MKKLLLILTFAFSSCTILFSQEICNNGIDDDANGLIDLNDPGCSCSGIGGGTPSSLIPNASFENNTCCPTTFSQLSCASSWVQASAATSDYFNCGYNFPAATAAGISSPNGTGYVGAIVSPGYTEYIGACLSSPLLAGTSYTFEIQIASSPIDNFGNVCNGGSIFYSPLNLTYYGSTSCGNLPYSGYDCPMTVSGWQVLGSTVYNPSPTWGTVSVTFTPTQDIYSIIFGAPCSLPADYSNACYPYFYYDNLVLNTSTSFNPVSVVQSGGICTGNASITASTSATGGSWQWYFNGVAIVGQTGTVLNVSAVGLGAGDYTAVYTVGAQCDAASTTFTGSPPNTTITPAGPFCANSPATNLTAATAGGTWSGTGITNGSAGTFNPATAGPGTHTITYSIAGACPGSSVTNIVVNPVPTVNTIANISACPGDPIVASNFSSTPTGSTFTWTNSNTAIGLGANGTGNTPAFTATNGTGSPISGTVSVTPSLNGCTGSPINYTITVNDLFDATINPAGPFCESSASVNLTAVDGGGTWSGNGITNSTLGTFDPASAGAGTHTITYTITGSCGSTDTENIIVNPDLDATITAAGPFCTTDPAVALTAVDAGGTWSGTGITNTTLGIFDPSIAGAGTWTITYSIGGMCGDTQTTNIIVNNQLDATITPVANVCEQDAAFNLSAVDPGGNWSGTGITNVTLGTFDPATAGPGTHTITYTLGGNCGDVQTTDIVVLPNMDATISAAGPFCVGNSSVNLTAVDAGGVWSGNGITDANLGTFDPATAGVGVHTITYTIAGQCGDVGTVMIEVVPNFSAAITQVGPFCADDPSVTLVGATPGGTWSGIGITNPATGVFNPSTAGAGTHTITYTIPGACGDVQTIDIVVNPLPIPTFTADVLSGCAPLTVTFTDNTVPTGTTALWVMSDGFTSGTLGTVTNTFSNPGSYTVSLTLTSAQGCTATTTIANMITVFSNPIADFSFGPNDATVVSPTINFTNESIGASIYTWDFGGLGTSNATNPSFNFPSDSPNTYQVCLTAETVNGCIDSTCQLIEIHDEFLLFVPNAFTPDADGINDEFRAVVNGHDPLTFEFLIFNRWGELIFSSQNDGLGWDGNYKGIMSQEDVYVWKIKVKQLSNGQLHEFVGHVSLLR